jgi:hypothetical protein
MAYVTARPGGTWEVRETLSTPKGPRSRTLASFRTLSAETIERSRSRAARRLSADDVRAAARRAGAPVELPAADRAAGDLLRELAAGRGPHPILRSLLADALRDGPSGPRLGDPRRSHGAGADVIPLRSLDNARAGAAWLTATPAQRGEALRDLLLLADRLPHRAGRERPRFPRLERTAA